MTVGARATISELHTSSSRTFSSRLACPDQMPPWAASTPRSLVRSRAHAIERLTSSLRCRHVANESLRVRSSLNFRARSASTLVSPTAINYRPNIPPRNEELYNALSALSKEAEQWVNLSRLQLALRGLAVEDAVTRVAVVGVGRQGGAKKLARLLLADPLKERGEWEGELEGGGEDAVLLRYENYLLDCTTVYREMLMREIDLETKTRFMRRIRCTRFFLFRPGYWKNTIWRC